MFVLWKKISQNVKIQVQWIMDWLDLGRELPEQITNEMIVEFIY